MVGTTGGDIFCWDLPGTKIRLNDLDDATERTIVAKAAHPNYDDDAPTPAYDFIILKLNQPVTQKPITLNRSINNPSDNEDITVIGFGATSEGGSGSDILQEVKVKAVHGAVGVCGCSSIGAW